MSKSSSRKGKSSAASQRSENIDAKELFAAIARARETNHRPGPEWKTATEWAEEAEMSPQHTRLMLKDGVKHGIVEKMKNGPYYWFRKV